MVHIHIPKTAGNWVRKALQRVTGPWKVVEGPFGFEDKSAHGFPGKWNYPIVFAVVRHPATWLRSAWGNRILEKGRPYPEAVPWQTFCTITDPYLVDNFEKYVMNLCEYRPGVITWLFSAYTPPPVQVYRLGPELNNFIDDLGGDLTELPRNVGEVSHIEISQKVYDALYISERECYRRYGWAKEGGYEQA
jgi:hypothetical protein